MAGTSSNPKFTTRVVKKSVGKLLAEDKALEGCLDRVWDKDSLSNYGEKIYKSIAKFGVLEVAHELEKDLPEPPLHRSINIGRNNVLSYSYSRNPSVYDLQDRAMEAFKDATKDCEDEEMKQQFDMIQDYYSLDDFVFRFYKSMVNSGVLDSIREIRQRVVLPVVAVHTYVIGVGVTAGNTSAALKAFQHMSASGIAPTSYSYAVLITGLTADPNYCGDAKKFLLEMMDKGMSPNAATYTAVIEGFAKLEDKAAEEEGKQLVEAMMHKGFVPNAKAMMEVLKGKPTPLIRRVINIALSKLKG